MKPNTKFLIDLFTIILTVGWVRNLPPETVAIIQLGLVSCESIDSSGITIFRGAPLCRDTCR